MSGWVFSKAAIESVKILWAGRVRVAFFENANTGVCRRLISVEFLFSAQYYNFDRIDKELFNAVIKGAILGNSTDKEKREYCKGERISIFNEFFIPSHV